MIYMNPKRYKRQLFGKNNGFLNAKYFRWSDTVEVWRFPGLEQGDRTNCTWQVVQDCTDSTGGHIRYPRSPTRSTQHSTTSFDFIDLQVELKIITHVLRSQTTPPSSLPHWTFFAMVHINCVGFFLFLTMIALSRSFRFGPVVRVSTMSRSNTSMSLFCTQHVLFPPTSHSEINL